MADANTSATGIESTQQENRLFPPPKDFAAEVSAAVGKA